MGLIHDDTETGGGETRYIYQEHSCTATQCFDRCTRLGCQRGLSSRIHPCPLHCRQKLQHYSGEQAHLSGRALRRRGELPSCSRFRLPCLDWRTYMHTRIYHTSKLPSTVECQSFTKDSTSENQHGMGFSRYNSGTFRCPAHVCHTQNIACENVPP